MGLFLVGHNLLALCLITNWYFPSGWIRVINSKCVWMHYREYVRVVVLGLLARLFPLYCFIFELIR